MPASSTGVCAGGSEATSSQAREIVPSMLASSPTSWLCETSRVTGFFCWIAWIQSHTPPAPTGNSVAFGGKVSVFMLSPPAPKLPACSDHRTEASAIDLDEPPEQNALRSKADTGVTGLSGLVGTVVPQQEE